MYLQLFAVLLAAAPSFAKYDSSVESRFSGGFYTSVSRFPHAVFILTTPSIWTISFWWNFACGGTLINDRYVVTVASCLYDSDGKVIDKRLFQVISGREYIHASLRSQYEDKYTVEEVLPHQNFYPSDERRSNFYNIGLLRLNEAVSVFSQKPAVLSNHSYPEVDYTKKVIYAAGWGSRGDESDEFFNDDEFSRQIKAVMFTAKSTEFCDKYFRRNPYTSEFHFCGQYDSYRQPCHGDVGAGLVYSDDNEETWILVGMVLWHNGSDCSKIYPNTHNKAIKIRPFNEDWIQLLVYV